MCISQARRQFTLNFFFVSLFRKIAPILYNKMLYETSFCAFMGVGWVDNIKVDLREIG
jgi:hypothetical protein